VFLFQTSAEYREFYERSLGVDDEGGSKGLASRDYYATWNEVIGDPVHLHEATHQIFRQRLGLGGGGDWFQEGVAGYVTSKPAERAAVAAAFKKQAPVPLAELVRTQSVPCSTAALGGDRAGQAALVIEFLRESKWAKDRFPAFLQRVGRIPDRNHAEVEDALAEVYGVDLAGLEERWVEYLKKR